MRVLGIDTSLRSTGLGVVEARGTRLSAVDFTVVKAARRLLHSECLKLLSAGVDDIVERTAPEAVAIEGVFYCRNVKTAVTLGQARGAAMAVCAARGLPIYEYAPRRVKQAVVGFGSAGKEQVGRMVMMLLGLKVEVAEDAGDALALAICHLHSATQHAALMPKPI